jgi:hypothetical protein
VRRIARGLELVERCGRSGLVGRKLIDDEHVAAGPRRPASSATMRSGFAT